MNCDETWSYLDEMNKNLLYLYTQKLIKGSNNSRGYFTVSNTGNSERDDYLNAERRKHTAYYLIWFVYRYVLRCETLQSALQYADINILNKYKLSAFFLQMKLYVGIHGINHLFLRDPEQDIKLVLEILYNRYDVLEQIEAYVRCSKAKRRMSQGSKVLCETVELMEKCKNPAFNQVLNRYYERQENNEENTYDNNDKPCSIDLLVKRKGRKCG